MKEIILEILESSLFKVTFGALLGFLLSQFGAWQKNKREDRLLILELEASIFSQKFLIKTILKDLSMYKVHKQYYLRAADLLEFTGPDPEEDIKSSMRKHYEKGQEARQTEEKLDHALQALFKTMFQLSRLKNKTLDKDLMSQLVDFEHPKSDKFKEIASLDELPKALEREEKRMIDDYSVFNNLVENFTSIH
ncbi:MAG: hypothetical protein Roseis2KO_52740 [Roseivirga sp.]